jgi:hypothetical protein
LAVVFRKVLMTYQLRIKEVVGKGSWGAAVDEDEKGVEPIQPT